MTVDIRPLIGLAAERPLTQDEADGAFAALFEGAVTPAQIGGLLMAMRVRGETVDEMAAATRAMRARMNRITAPEGDVTTPITRGRNGRARLRSWSNSPSAASALRRFSSIAISAPAPAGSIWSTII